MKTIVKIAGIGVPLVLSGIVQAVTFAPATTPQNASAGTGAYITNGFNFGLSANVGLAYTENISGVAINAGNTKGKNSFGINSTGGAVGACTAAAVSTANGYSISAPSITGNGCT